MMYDVCMCFRLYVLLFVISCGYIALLFNRLWDVQAVIGISSAMIFIFWIVLLIKDRRNTNYTPHIRYTYLILITFVTIAAPIGLGSSFVTIFRALNETASAQFLVFLGRYVCMCVYDV